MTLSRWQDDIHVLGSARVSTNMSQPSERDRARRFVASQAEDAGDCAELLDALGLAPVGGEWT